MTHSPLRFIALGTAALILAASCSAGSDSGAPLAQKSSAKRSSTQPSSAPAGSKGLSWGHCSDTTADTAGLECADLDVPIDPKHPTGATTSLTLARLAASGTDSSKRIGSLVMNPGGPGGSGIEFLANSATSFPKALRQRFDLVSFDPRGVGQSSPVHCLTDAEKDQQLTGDLSPDTPEEFERSAADQTTLRKGCETKNPALIQHMSTADVAADLDRIRVALGDDKLTFLGFSYGTSIAATYATLYPKKVRALVLDGSVSPSATEEETDLTQAQGFEHTLGQFVAACNADARCPLAPDAASAIAATRASLAMNPVTVTDKTGDRLLGPDLFDLGIATGLYQTDVWGSMAKAIKDVRTDGAKLLFSLVDRQTGRDQSGMYDNSTDAQSMVNCADSPERLTEADADAAAQRIAQAAPTFGPLLGTSVNACVGWPVAANPTPTPTAPDAPPLLVVGTLGDPATPYQWAQQMTAALGPKTTLLTYEGDGHTAFLTGGRCIQDGVVDYLVDLEVPAAGTRCPAQSDAASFGGFRDTLVDELTKSGVPAELANCLVDGMIAEVGEDKLNRLVLDNDQDELTKLAARQALACATKGGG